MAQNIRAHYHDYASLCMQFQMMGSTISLQGSRDNKVSEMSSTQFKLHNSNSIYGHFHLALSTTKDSTNQMDVPPELHSILHQFNDLFQELENFHRSVQQLIT